MFKLYLSQRQSDRDYLIINLFGYVLYVLVVWIVELRNIDDGRMAGGGGTPLENYFDK